ncbi:hypothetical protein TVAG_399500 [Trichomonas vaginalis G3]|uniref:Uncharacterized protein n=1 Tax=Trichomonas vaginalis (strain ATCC PRA-98 / G3) TaxID=412133 RepID=A2E5Y8_TRIV3|nr:hypothetical protein TVAG_399500 [Trichomonas vaginalis G3]|eukprot:XP_001324168.1 hypothetical protein [Trichomonas vaginalis G3]
MSKRNPPPGDPGLKELQAIFNEVTRNPTQSQQNQKGVAFDLQDNDNQDDVPLFLKDMTPKESDSFLYTNSTGISPLLYKQTNNDYGNWLKNLKSPHLFPVNEETTPNQQSKGTTSRNPNSVFASPLLSARSGLNSARKVKTTIFTVISAKENRTNT